MDSLKRVRSCMWYVTGTGTGVWKEKTKEKEGDVPTRTE